MMIKLFDMLGYDTVARVCERFLLGGRLNATLNPSGGKPPLGITTIFDYVPRGLSVCMTYEDP